MNIIYFTIRRTFASVMETESSYFSPKKTRNFAKKHGLSLLQKVTLASKAAEPVPTERKLTRSSKAKGEMGDGAAQTLPKVTAKGRKKNIRLDSASETKVSIKTEQLGELTTVPVGEKTPVKQEQSHGNRTPIKRVDGLDEMPVNEAVKIKVELVDEFSPSHTNLEKTPTKQEPIECRSAVKREPEDDKFDTCVGKEAKWEPFKWREMMENIREMRRTNLAPVDTMGCDQFTQDAENALPDRTKRYHCLVSLILSSQTKDQANHECMQRLKKHGLTPESIVATEDAVLQKLIYPVGFYKNKTKFIKQVSQILIDRYDGDIPNTIEDLLKLPGVGKKMAHLCMRSAWNIVTGIGVDTHVHRISNWLQWVPKETKNPEETRIALEKWLPYDLWDEVNHMLVGFGQTICTSRFPRCNDCLNAPICPARGKQPMRSTPIKKEIKMEDLEF